MTQICERRKFYDLRYELFQMKRILINFDIKYSNLKKALKIFKRLIAVIASFLLIYVISIFLLPKIKFAGEPSTSTSIPCFLKSNGAHVDVVMPIRSDYHDWSKVFDQSHIQDADSTFSWIAFGWGDKNFYLNTPTWGDLTFTTAFSAAFWLSSGAIHVTYYKELSKSESCLPFELSPQQARRLFAFIKNDLHLNENQQALLIPTDRVYGSRDAFYDSKKSYSLFHTCNTWVNDALNASDFKHCFWTALEFGVMDLLR